MYSKVYSSCLYGLDGKQITVEVDISSGLPGIHLVGLPDSAVKESTERVRAAIKNSGFQYPQQRVIVNLAPADMRKEGSSFDLAIAVGILLASKQIEVEKPEKTLFIGELSLEGTLRPVQGILPMLDNARKQGIQKIVLPAQQTIEARLIPGLKCCPVTHLKMIAADMQMQSHLVLPSHGRAEQSPKTDNNDPQTEDYLDVKGQFHAKRSLMIAAAGMHNVLFVGPPGTGKTMLMQRLPSILPPLSDEEAMEVTKIHSASCKEGEMRQLIRTRPFRSPHHTISSGGMIGGGSIPKPGEVSLAHRGVLYLDELPEFQRHTLEVLRQPLEDGTVTISRAKAVFTFPASFLFAATMNPCPCGYAQLETRAEDCRCTEHQIRLYRTKVSGPLLDRMDLQLEIPRLSTQDLQYSRNSAGAKQLSSNEMRKKVLEARKIQEVRYATLPIQFNSDLKGTNLKRYAQMTHKAEKMLNQVLDCLGISLRAYDRLIKISRTIADLEGSDRVEEDHIAEAVQYRCFDRKREDQK